MTRLVPFLFYPAVRHPGNREAGRGTRAGAARERVARRTLVACPAQAVAVRLGLAFLALRPSACFRLSDVSVFSREGSLPEGTKPSSGFGEGGYDRVEPDPQGRARIKSAASRDFPLGVFLMASAHHLGKRGSGGQRGRRNCRSRPRAKAACR
jgi:hypothetical protein